MTAFILGKVLKQSAEEFGGMLADRVRFWRLKQAIGLKDKTEAILRERGIVETRAVPLKLTVAVIEGATIEEDDDLHTRWAKLLANALDPSFNEEVRIAYTEILRTLSPFDAKLLDEIYSQTEYLAKELNRAINWVEVDLAKIGEKIGAKKDAVLVSADCLLRQRLISQKFNVDDSQQMITSDGDEIGWAQVTRIIGLSQRRVALTELGFAFVRCCR